MYARPKVEIFIPKPNQKYGYDLMIGDWVAPDGTGRTADLVFEVTGYVNSFKDYDSILTISFSHEKDGIQPFEVPPAQKGSALGSPREAPLEGYKSKLTFHRVRKPGQWSPDWIDDTKEARSYFFRVRTVLDDKGEIKSALYGKIGGFTFGGAVEHGNLTIGPSYLNPEPNSRNMEFDLKRNLFTRLKRGEQVTAP
jgi:hypothetical protein